MCTGLEFLVAAAAATGAVSSIQQGRAARAAHEFNVQLAERDAETARRAAAADEVEARRQAAKRVGSQRAALAASGVDLTGTPLDLLAETAEDDELNALRVRFGGETQAQGFQGRAASERFSGRQAMRAGVIGAVGQGLTGAGNVALLRSR